MQVQVIDRNQLAPKLAPQSATLLIQVNFFRVSKELIQINSPGGIWRQSESGTLPPLRWLFLLSEALRQRSIGTRLKR